MTIFPEPAYRRAHLLLWISMVTLLVGIGLGMAWDRAYHTRFPFDSFFSPPHLFIYTMCGIATFFVGWLCLDPSTRLAFGHPIRLPLVGREISGALILYAGGLATVGFGGMVLDNIWHSSFGLDETGWSFPHSMLGWGLLVTALGFVGCRLGLRSHRPFAWYTPFVMGWLVVAFSAAPFLGPVGKNQTPATVRAVASIPVLSVQPEAQHTFRIYLRWNLNRTHPAFAPIAALWAGVALALLRGLDRRPGSLVIIPTLAALSSLGADRRASEFLGVAGDPANWLPVPLPAAAILAALLLAMRAPPRWAYAAAGAAVGVFSFVIWGRLVTPDSAGASTAGLACLLAPSAILAAVLGSGLGEKIFGGLEAPTARFSAGLVFGMGLGLPFLTGLLDLFLRFSTS